MQDLVDLELRRVVTCAVLTPSGAIAPSPPAVSMAKPSVIGVKARDYPGIETMAACSVI